MSYLKRCGQIKASIQACACEFSDNEAEFNLDTDIENDETDEQFSASNTTTGVDDCGITDVEGFNNEWDICLSKSKNCLTSSDSNMSEQEDKMANDLGKSLGSWVIKYRVPREGVSKESHKLPADSRTLLKIPEICNIENIVFIRKIWNTEVPGIC